jgi:hypothetical protein
LVDREGGERQTKYGEGGKENENKGKVDKADRTGLDSKMKNLIDS